MSKFIDADLMLADEEKQCFLGGNYLKYYAIFRERGELQRIGFLIFKKFLLLVSAMHWLKMTRRKFLIFPCFVMVIVTAQSLQDPSLQSPMVIQ